MKYVLDHENKPYAKYFEDISAIPRGSFKEDAIADYVVQFAKDLGLNYYRDKTNNVVIYKPATAGYEDHETVMLQGHMDMIWNKRPGCDFDFATQGINLVVEDGWLFAPDTTCGSDDGVALCYMMAILADDTIPHPPLECVFTAAEEPGINGALAFDCSVLKARKYISMDGNLEGTSLLIAAGGINGDFVKKFEREDMPGKKMVSLRVHGLQGGHSGNAMNKEGENALKVIARMLHYIIKELDANLISIDGGSYSTIPTDMTAKIALDEGAVERALEIAEKVMDEVKYEHKESDPDAVLAAEVLGDAIPAMDRETTYAVVTLLYLLPVGLTGSSLVFEKLPITSNSLEMIATTENEICWRYKPQSALTSKMLDMEEQTHILGDLFGVEYRIDSRYYGHNIQPHTPLYEIYDQVWYEMTGKHIEPIGAHYWNEIGTFLERMPWLDVILPIATHFGAHTPDEKLDMESFDRVYRAVVKILERC